MFGLEVTAGEPKYVYECVTKQENVIITQKHSYKFIWKCVLLFHFAF